MNEEGKERGAGESTRLDLTGTVGIENAEQLRQLLQERLAEFDSVEIGVDHLDGIDIYGIQVLCSAHRTALAANKTVTMSSARPEPVREALRLNGFVRRFTCSASNSPGCLCLFCEEEHPLNTAQDNKS